MARITNPLGGRRFPLGSYRDLITVQAPATPGSETWTDVAAELWAHVAPLSGYERIQAAQLQSSIDYRVTIPNCPITIDATMRLQWATGASGATVVLQIQDVILAVGETVCDCVEGHA